MSDHRPLHHQRVRKNSRVPRYFTPDLVVYTMCSCGLEVRWECSEQAREWVGFRELELMAIGQHAVEEQDD